MYDLIVLGAGPAGSTLASLAATLPGLRLLVLDARPLDRPFRPGDRRKSCGGLLAPAAQRALARLHGALPAALLADPQLFAVRAIDLGTGRERWYQRFYVNIRREAFDRWLYARAANLPGVEAVCGAPVTALRRTARGWMVRTADGRMFAGRFLAGADGACSPTRRRLFPSLPVRRYVSIQEAFPAEAAAPHFAAVFAPELTDYYAWGLPKDDEYLIGAALPEGRGALARFDRLKVMLRPYGFRPDAPLRREGTLITRPQATFSIGASVVLPEKNACLLGEAAGFISPSSAEGVSFDLNSAAALYHGLRAALGRHDATHAAFFGEVCRNYLLHLAPLRAALAAKSLKSQILYAPAPRRLVMASGLAALTPLPHAKE